jgi:hypothetical protein
MSQSWPGLLSVAAQGATHGRGGTQQGLSASRLQEYGFSSHRQMLFER